MKTRRILGIAVTWQRVAFALVLAIACVAFFIFAPSRVRLQAANGPVSLGNFGFDSAAYFLGVKEAELERREIAVVDGSLWEWTGVRLELIFIRSGVAQGNECGESFGTNNGRLDHPLFRYRMHAQVALGRAYTKQGCFAFLGQYGMPGGGKGPTQAPCHSARVKRSYDRNLVWWKKEIIYVEGDAEPVISPGMSLEEFCKKNGRGEFLVVIASLRDA
jgi:hypothetical protein